MHDQGYEYLDYQGILAQIQGLGIDMHSVSETEESEPPLCYIKHKETRNMLNKCLISLQPQPEATPLNTSIYNFIAYKKIRLLLLTTYLLS